MSPPAPWIFWIHYRIVDYMGNFSSLNLTDILSHVTVLKLLHLIVKLLLSYYKLDLSWIMCSEIVITGRLGLRHDIGKPRRRVKCKFSARLHISYRATGNRN